MSDLSEEISEPFLGFNEQQIRFYKSKFYNYLAKINQQLSEMENNEDNQDLYGDGDGDDQEQQGQEPGAPDQDLLNDFDQDNGEPDEEEDFGDLFFNESPESFGPSLQKKVAEAGEFRWNKRFSPEEKTKLKETVKFPENVKALVVPKLDEDLWISNEIPKSVKANDARIQNIQHHASKAGASFLVVVDKLFNSGDNWPKAERKKLCSILLDGYAHSSIVSDELLRQRYQGIKKVLRPEMAGICNDIKKPREFLFNGEYDKKFRAAKNMSSSVKQSFSKGRSAPYPKGRGKPFPGSAPTASSSNSLNFRGPRGYGGNRGKANFVPSNQVVNKNQQNRQ